MISIPQRLRRLWNLSGTDIVVGGSDPLYVETPGENQYEIPRIKVKEVKIISYKPRDPVKEIIGEQKEIV